MRSHQPPPRPPTTPAILQLTPDFEATIHRAIRYQEHSLRSNANLLYWHRQEAMENLADKDAVPTTRVSPLLPLLDSHDGGEAAGAKGGGAR